MCPLCVSQGAEISGELVCGACRRELLSSRDLRRDVVWEKRGGLSLFRAFLTTWRDVVFSPRSFFGGLDAGGALFKPLLFAVICLTIGLIGGLWGISEAARAVSGQAGIVLVVLVVAVAPATYVVSFAATVGFLHLLARGFGGDARFRATARAVAYSQAAAVAEIIPGIGGIVAFVLRLSLYGWGVSAVHGLSTPRAFAFYVVILLVAVGSVFFLVRLVTPMLPPGI